jgi:S1-C subfamily serine protease
MRGSFRLSRRWRGIPAWALVALLVVGCQSPYGPKLGSLAIGYSEVYVGRDQYQITVGGSGITTEQTLDEYFFRRAKEIQDTNDYISYSVKNLAFGYTPGTLETAGLGLPSVTGVVQYYRSSATASPSAQPMQPTTTTTTTTAPQSEVPASTNSNTGQETTRTIKATGTGFIIDAIGHILTEQHVIDGCGGVSVGGPDEKVRQSAVVASDEANDLALLKAPNSIAQFAHFRTGTEIRQGEGIVAVGYPFAGLLAYGTNVTTGTVSALAGLRNDARMLQVTAPVQPGNSGGPLLDASGNVVGLVEAELDAITIVKATGDIPQNVNFAIKSSIVRTFAEANGIGYHVAASATDMSVPDIAARAKKFTVLVVCWQ